MVLRPLAGDLADRIGRRPLVLLGTAIFALAPLGSLAIGTVPGLLLLREFHGTGMGFGPTAATVIATDLTAPGRRGAAMGAHGLSSAVALAVGPYLGAELVRGAGFSVTFLVATAIEIAALALASMLAETRPVTDSPPAAAPASGAAASSAERLARF
jgi:MFS family permease